MIDGPNRMGCVQITCVFDAKFVVVCGCAVCSPLVIGLFVFQYTSKPVVAAQNNKRELGARTGSVFQGAGGSI